MTTHKADVYLDDEIEEKVQTVGITIDRNEKDGCFSVLISNPSGIKGKLSSTGKTFVLGSAVERYGKLKVTVMVTRDNK